MTCEKQENSSLTKQKRQKNTTNVSIMQTDYYITWYNLKHMITNTRPKTCTFSFDNHKWLFKENKRHEISSTRFQFQVFSTVVT